MLTLAAVGMAIAGQVTRQVLIVACVCLPVTLGEGITDSSFIPEVLLPSGFKLQSMVEAARILRREHGPG